MEKYNAVYGKRVIAFEAESYRKALLLACAHFETSNVDKITLRAVAPWRPFEVKSYRTINKPDGGSYEAAFIRYTDGMEPKVAYIPSNELDKA